MKLKDFLVFMALPYSKPPTTKRESHGALTATPFGPASGDPDTWKHYLSEVATSVVIPLLVPTVTALAGWYANRRHMAQVKQNEALKEEMAQIRDDIRVSQFQAAAYPSYKPDKSRQRVISMEEEDELKRVNEDLAKISEQLQRRQDIYCSRLTSRRNRHDIEEQLKEFAFSKPYDKELRLYSGLINIFQYDGHCDQYGPHKNGCIMWVYLDMWRAMARIRKHQRIESRLRHEGVEER